MLKTITLPYDVGDLVFSTYHKKEYLFKVTKIERRYIDQNDLRYNCYANCQVGDEKSPLVSIIAVSNLSIVADPNKKFRKTGATIDAAYIKKVEPTHIQAHIRKLNDLITEMWP